MELLDAYFTVAPLGSRGHAWSCFAAALRDARRASGRDEASGEIADTTYTMSWLAAIGYLCLFDQLGTAVQLVAVPTGVAQRVAALPQSGAERAFRSALYQFSDVTERDSATLWALRCSLAHNFSLVNVGRRPELCHRFTLDGSRQALVRYSRQPWNGQHPGAGGPTKVSIALLGELGEAVAVRVMELNEQCALMSRVSDAEFHARYFMELLRPRG